MVPYPACVGRLDRLLPGWTERELQDSIELVRTLMLPDWDIHPEMVTHTRVVDTRTGHPYPDNSLPFMENWDWTTGKSVDEIADYQTYALRILHNIGLPCEGVTTPGGYGSRARPQLAQATLESVRDVYGADVPHYFRDMFVEGEASVAPRVELAADLAGPDPRCVVSIVGCAGDWTGGWDNRPPEGADRFITADLQHGRMVDVIQRGEPALMVCHWTGIHWNGQELGFHVFQEVVRRLQARFDHLVWMKLSEITRYWAARELTEIKQTGTRIELHAPLACPDFTLRCHLPGNGCPQLRVADSLRPLIQVDQPLRLTSDTWYRDGQEIVACFALPKGRSILEINS